MLALGRAVARNITAPTFLVGRDTRRSGPMLQAALSAGLASEGADVVDVGVAPTPTLAWLSATRDLPAVVISASHNPFADNGIKLFAAGGAKLSAEMEAAIEDELERILEPSTKGPRSLEGHGVGSLGTEPGVGDAYAEHLSSLLEGRSLEGLRLVVDSANGAASVIAAGVYERLGAEVVAIGCEPDGTNINDGCGSTATEVLARAVVEHGADLGLALDGDADRLLAVDAGGTVANGDELLALFALDLAERGLLAGNTVVVTVMTNLGFRMAMEERGIVVKETAVGDRYVLAALDKDGFALGGEQSGHIIFRRLATTGDGLLTGLMLSDLVQRAGRPWPSCWTVWSTGSPRCWSTSRSRTPSCSTMPPPSGRPWPRRRPVSAMPAGYCCAPVAPSRWSGSWSRPAVTAWPRPSPSVSAPWWASSCEPRPPPTADAVPPAGLTSEEIDAFVRDGFVRVEGASRRVADEGRARLWDEMGLSPHQPAGWSEAVIRLPGSGAPPFDRAVNTERLHVSFDQLVGPGRWVRRSGLGTFPIRFPNRPEPDDTGWHCDGSFGDWPYRLNLRVAGPGTVDALPVLRHRRRRCANQDSDRFPSRCATDPGPGGRAGDVLRRPRPPSGTHLDPTDRLRHRLRRGRVPVPSLSGPCGPIPSRHCAALHRTAPTGAHEGPADRSARLDLLTGGTGDPPRTRAGVVDRVRAVPENGPGGKVAWRPMGSTNGIAIGLADHRGGPVSRPGRGAAGGLA